MGDKVHMIRSKEISESKAISNKLSKNCLVASKLNGITHKTKRVALKGQDMLRFIADGDIGFFVLKTVSLEILRRFSLEKFPFVWHGLQATQVLCCLPLNWIQKWRPFESLVGFMKTLSRPLLVLSIATLFSKSDSKNQIRGNSGDAQLSSETALEPSSPVTNEDIRSGADIPLIVTPPWFQELQNELEKQGISLPHRLNEDEISRFHTSVNGDFPRLVASIKKTIRWRQNFTFLSTEELESWSHLAFWHGCDVQRRPSLIVRLGLACSKLRFSDMDNFAKAVVSQIEYGVCHLVDAENPQVTVLMDCEGLSPFGFPMQMMRSLSILLQDHYPNRLGYLIVSRLPPVARVITQTLFRVLRPNTQQKLRIIGENYQEVLSEYLQTLPSFLGGTCSCIRCSDSTDTDDSSVDTIQEGRTVQIMSKEDVSSQPMRMGIGGLKTLSAEQMLTFSIIVIFMVWMFVSFLLARQHSDAFFPFMFG
ncbi:phosphatidylinositol/phosphatidylcholine transfer protein SFH4-like [Impatiens glandulifera]|uniref:phosphatidylinositol/phosphatidylcholine transfer protein SFH4-like n=1 Tax=Impatiens glandulifera TaxID=253017 RepID=UPI001FB0B7B6|nr:phosphatidylinositol/phosphatidylcholine transfer protein SFH4-like [Impatiens glandulifera]XP_047316221.1 phosphatidylinositol/phosphatidylcholine transfer protein SFH4-like [Impatiens glandulifera]